MRTNYSINGINPLMAALATCSGYCSDSSIMLLVLPLLTQGTQGTGYQRRHRVLTDGSIQAWGQDGTVGAGAPSGTGFTMFVSYSPHNVYSPHFTG